MRRVLLMPLLLGACASQPAAPPVERALALLLPARSEAAPLEDAQLEMVRRASADFLRRQLEVPVRLVSDLELAAVSAKYRDADEKCGTVEDTWRRTYPTALPAIVMARCEGDACRVVVSVRDVVFSSAVANPADVGAWVTAVGGLKRTAETPAVLESPPSCEAESTEAEVTAPSEDR